LIIDEMIPRIKAESLADYIDVFCDRGFFTISEAEQIVEAGLKAGLTPKLHVSELDNIGGVQLGIRHNALSVDHLECAGEQEIKALGSASTMATLLPSCAFFLNLPYPDARGLINSGAAVALATDFNPGTSPSGRMPFVISLACIKMRMLPEEAINAATINGAFAMEVQDQVGRLAPGKMASFIITKTIPSVEYLPYAFGEDVIGQVYICGREFTESK
jgi:imidazolonepropionase